MDETFHIPRTLCDREKRFSEQALFGEFKVIVVLSEPGGGKTALLQKFARQIGSSVIKASGFTPDTSCESLIVDALDEVSRLPAHDISPLLKEIRSAGAVHVILSSRSGEWEEADSQKVATILGIEPKIVHLLPLSEQEQRAMLAHEFPAESFDEFSSQVHRYDLQHLLGNPEFLKLFAAAYIEGGSRFRDRRSIFEDAVKHLAREANSAVPQRDAPTRSERIAWAEEAFAKIMLSGADGVAVAGAWDERRFPHLTDLGVDARDIHAILDTKLFKPGRITGQHEPVHRIVAEYCAARYLNRRIGDSRSAFSAHQCLSLIAPNGVTREELRGLLGWLAAFGSQQVQELAIATDPYAVLANGDPSRLTPRSKKRLLKGLMQLETVDPYFRRSDHWRRFSASDFFTADVVDELRGVLNARGGSGHLQGLLLQLLDGSPAAAELQPELKMLMHDPQADINLRLLAANCIAGSGRGEISADINSLVAEDTLAGLVIACHLCTEVAALRQDRELILRLLRRCCSLSPSDNVRVEHSIEFKGRVRELIRCLDRWVTEWLLDQMTDGLACTCNAEDPYTCDCRDAISKIVGRLLDRHFEMAKAPHDAVKIYGWIENLIFHHSIRSEDSLAVRTLRDDDALRRAIQLHVLGGLTDSDQIHKALFNIFRGEPGHSGLFMSPEDQEVLSNFAFEAGNVTLWACFMPTHLYYDRTTRGPNPARAVYRAQANQKPEFMARWARLNRYWKKNWHTTHDRRGRLRSRRRRRERIAEVNKERSLVQNKSIIECGEHWGWLRCIAYTYLQHPETLEEELGGKIDFERALRNSLTAQAEHVPGLQTCAVNPDLEITRILYAGCLAEYRAKRRLDGVDRAILQAVKIDRGGYDGVSEEETSAFVAELDRNLFTSAADREHFLRELVEPQLVEAFPSNVWWLDSEPGFQPFRSTLPLEWLSRFPEMSYASQKHLFDICARHGDRHALFALIEKRCDEVWNFIGPVQPDRDTKAFWFLRHFYFIESGKPDYWQWLSGNPDTIFTREQTPGCWREREDAGWPELTAPKIGQILEAFVDEWPPVPLPSVWGTGSPRGETAYRYLKNVVWAIGRDDPDIAIPVLDELLENARLAGFKADLLSIRASSSRAKASRNFQPPSPEAVVRVLADGEVASVEHMRAVVLECLSDLQADIKGGDLDELETYYAGDRHISENAATKRIVSWLRPRLHALEISDAIEHQLKGMVSPRAVCPGRAS